MQPLHVQIHLRTPMGVSDVPFHFDGLLAWARVQEAEAAGALDSWEVKDDLPLERAGPVWKASQIFFRRTGEPQRMALTRRFPALEMAEASQHTLTLRKNVLRPGKGETKAYNLRRSVCWVPLAEAWCVGDLECVRSLLTQVHTLGPKRALSQGRVRHIEVSPALEKDTENWRLRALPTNSGLEHPDWAYVDCFGTLCSPYWSRKAATEIRSPVLPVDFCAPGAF